MPDPIIFCDNLVKSYRMADLEVVALQKLKLEVAPGEILTIVGPSGAGKSTLLNILGGLDIPDAGSCLVDGNDLAHMTSTQRITYRRYVVGQMWPRSSGRNLLPDLSAQANVELPQMLSGIEATQRAVRARELLALVGLNGKEHYKPAQLSAGEQQRNAIAVALANRPKILLADNPTGDLDAEVAAEIFALLRMLNQACGLTVITTTRDVTIGATADRTIVMRGGSISMG
jgi:ABC-type lipoprotein export system ATPase subunit